MLLPVMRRVNNFFEISKERGEFEIKDGAIAVSGKYLEGQFVAITGSILNNGVRRVESFADGVISFVIDNAAYPAWVQPEGGHDAHSIGDRVTHGGYRWISLINANIWEPGTDPRWWEKIIDSPEEHITVNERFSGTVYGLNVPRDFLELAEEIQEFNNRPSTNSDRTSESVLGAVSWTRATDQNGMPAGWQSIFSKKLNAYRRMFTEVKI